MAIFRPIDSAAEHHRVLFELGLLDDLEDWPLYQAQEARFFALDETIPVAQWRSYVRLGVAAGRTGNPGTVWNYSQTRQKHSLNGQNPVSDSKNIA